MNKILFPTLLIPLLCILFVGCRESSSGVKVITYDPADISANGALCGAEADLSNQEIYFAELGVCWSFSPHPTYVESSTNEGSNHIGTSEFSKPFTGRISHLKPNTKYYVRAYLKNLSNQEIYYGKTKSFKTTSGTVSVDGSLSGKFSVAMGEQICFSKGNLQYHPNQEIWRFAEHQWDFIGAENDYASATYNGWIDLFG